MKHELILFVLAFLIPACAFCQIDNPDSIKSIPGTGDIMVVARGCTPPPYETGLRLELNKMPENPPKIIATSFPDSMIGDRSLLYKLMEKYGRNSEGRLDTANGVILIKPSIYYFDDSLVSVGITDSIGRYVFSNLQPGNYQLILSGWQTYNPREEYEQSNRLYSHRNDFPEWNYYYPPNVNDKYLEELKRNPFYNVECRSKIINNIKIEFDSISVVKIATAIHDYNCNMTPNSARSWTKEMKARDGQNEIIKDK